jgi:DNA adenine methylase
MLTIPSLFPYHGGKSRVVALVHERMGRVAARIEPFAGTAVWALSAHDDGATTTVNDADGFITNCYRAIAADPDAVARGVDWPVSELDLHARHRWLVEQRDALEARLRTDPDYYDTKIAGWWLWGICQWIGDGWCPRSGKLHQQIPHLGGEGRTGMGVHRRSHRSGGMTVRELLEEYARRLRHMRIVCGDWRRVVTPAVMQRGTNAVFLDPPYPNTGMLYADGVTNVWEEAWAWAIANGDTPRLRIAICGYDDGRPVPPGWNVYRWEANGGYGNRANGAGRINAKRETIWFSTHCVNETPIERMIRRSVTDGTKRR